ncbi:diacylglycerol kinase family protein [Bacillus swezeyi]|uniref:diacylglycerol/lipid kinase family protein n=1 Tax=Bacillus swezeyi TaxID=1925020 RepID=UPI0039C6F169
MSDLYCFIVNKISGNGKALKIWNYIVKHLQEKHIEYQVRFTEAPNHATALVKELIKKEKPSVITAVGGDGTIHEVINGLLDANIPLGVIPAGSGNDFCRGLGIPLNYKKALKHLLKGECTTVDIGCLNSTFFSTVVGVGFDAEVAKVTNDSNYKKLLNCVRLGNLSYYASVLRVLFHYKPADIFLKIDSKHYQIQNVWLVAIANTPFYAGGLLICPNAKYQDGLFNICLVHGVSKWKFLKLFLYVFKGKHTAFSNVVNIYEGKEVEIYSVASLSAHGDGEIIGQTPARLKIEHNVLSVIR